MKLGMAIETLHSSENNLAQALLGLSDRHNTDHEIFHIARDIAKWSQAHVVELARAGRDYGLKLDEEPREDVGPASGLRQKASELVGRRPDPGLVLLADLRHLYREASGVSLDWELLAQGAQAAKNRELLSLAQRCHPETLRQVRWANAHLKVVAPQIMAS